MRQDYANLEVLVCDDASVEPVAEVALRAARRDQRIRYIPSATRLGMRDNFEQGLLRASGEFIMVLGGDDGVLPSGVSRMVAFLRETSSELATWAAPVYTYRGVRSSSSQLQMFRSGTSRIVDSRLYLARLGKSFNYLGDLETPMCYVKGVASRRLIDLVRSKSPDGRFYSCPTPDGYSGIALATEARTFAFSADPFTIFGISPSSQGMAFLDNSREGVTRSEEFFRSVHERPMHAVLAAQPYSPLIALMTADYLLTVKDWAGADAGLPEIDLRRVLLQSLAELSHGLFGRERVMREVTILEQIARHHGLGTWFASQVSRRRRRRTRMPFEGTGINPNSVLLDGERMGISNVAEAADACVTIARLAREAALANVVRSIYRSLVYKFASLLPGGPLVDR